MRTRQLREHDGRLEGIVREAETIKEITRFRLESKKDKEDYFCFTGRGDAPWLHNGQYVEVNFSGKYPLQDVQLDEKVRNRGRKVFAQPSSYPDAPQHPRPPKPIYIEVFELCIYKKKEGEILHLYHVPEEIEFGG